MILLLLILILMTGGIFAWISGKWNPLLARIISLVTIITDLAVVTVLFCQPGNLW